MLEIPTGAKQHVYLAGNNPERHPRSTWIEFAWFMKIDRQIAHFESVRSSQIPDDIPLIKKVHNTKIDKVGLRLNRGGHHTNYNTSLIRHP
ncbi:hypothetical protein T265_07203 [Opisthorchis viverrini]|uniref:Uncharacterized protein n=1 Tax=Opisthorchis viverrini TaxID=6198 RepID=A0A074ZDS6_OPIVI|nr:hypothetical protein T265_07203 [Opisthorchis viverrini]KER25328.1 hypothetical protein T265_07203 [Opisthorchis viverrini]